MTTSELLMPQHLSRKAIIYIWQSRPHQVLTPGESMPAGELGWQTEEIEILYADLGLSEAETHYREGFKELLTRVTLGEVGIILSVLDFNNLRFGIGQARRGWLEKDNVPNTRPLHTLLLL